MGEAAQAAVPSLVKHLTNRAMQYEVLLALERIGPAKESVAPLIELLANKDLDRAMRIVVLETLGKVAVDSKEAEVALEPFLKSMDTQARIAGAAALATVVPGHKEAMAILINELTEGSDVIQVLTLRALGRIGSPAAAAMPAIKRASASSSELVRHAAIKATARIETRK
jgi:HEAT repeat protein